MILSIILFAIASCYYKISCEDNNGLALYYYGLEESERGLPICMERQACSALLWRAWRAPALVRLCRCARLAQHRTLACDERAPQTHLLELNNQAHLQFCLPIDDSPQCSMRDNALFVETTYDRMNPDEMEEQHHRNILLTPPKITSSCSCRSPYYWKLNTTVDNAAKQIYHCAPLPLCKSGEYCGNVSYDLNALYQSCMCPKNHMCVHRGGLPNVTISELLYRGKGWRAFCQRINDDYEYEDYNY